MFIINICNLLNDFFASENIRKAEEYGKFEK